MKKYGFAGLLLILILSVVLLAGTGLAESIDSVVIDRSEKAYTTFVSLTREMAKEARPNVDTRMSAEMVQWKKFKKSYRKYITSGIIRNEYPGSRVEKGILEVLSKYSATPIGVTWNGGVAFTAFDYLHAEKTLEVYVSNPGEYEKTRVRDPKQDPVNPSSHFRSLLGWN
ncbi:MAG: hypothetical protein ACC669_00360 [bacterium]